MNTKLSMYKESAWIACRITDLLNDQNKLSEIIKWSDVLENIDQYVFIIDYSVIPHKVIACAKVRKMSYYLAEICHVSVNSDYQRQGYGKKILKLAEEKAEKTYGSYMLQSTIRLDNDASIFVFNSQGWKRIGDFVNELTGNKIIVVNKTIK